MKLRTVKPRTVKYFIKQGMINLYKQAMMSIATISIIAASFIVLGIFFFAIINLNNVARIMSNEPEVSVFCDVTIDDGRAFEIEEELKAMPEVDSVQRVTKEEAMGKLKDHVFRGYEDLLTGMNSEDFLPVSFNVKLKNAKEVTQVLPVIKSIAGIEWANSPVEIVNTIISFKNGIKLITVLLTIVLFVISILIISNAIKLTVHSRRREIGIMQYIGATDSFIRWPFIVEGLIMGIIGSCIAFVLVSFLYNWFANSSGNTSEVFLGGLSILKLYDRVDLSFFGLFKFDINIGVLMLVIFLVAGIFMGSAGSALSIRRYLKD